MSTNPSHLAFPTSTDNQTDSGMTKREFFAATALNGLLSGVDVVAIQNAGDRLPGRDLAATAVVAADRLIAALNNPNLLASTATESESETAAPEPGSRTPKNSDVSTPKGVGAPATMPDSREPVPTQSATPAKRTPPGSGNAQHHHS